MTNTKIKWHNEDYDLGCNIEDLEKLGFTNSTWKDNIAPSYSNGKIEIFFLQPKKEKEHEGRCKFSINKITKDHDFIKHLYETNHFYKVLQLAQLSNEINKNQ